MANLFFGIYSNFDINLKLKIIQDTINEKSDIKENKMIFFYFKQFLL